MSLLEEVSSTLTAAGIRHALIGAAALAAAYGVNRASVDLDLFAADASCLRPDLWADLQSRGVAVQVRKGDLTDPLAGVVRFQAPGNVRASPPPSLAGGGPYLETMPHIPGQQLISANTPRICERCPISRDNGSYLQIWPISANNAPYPWTTSHIYRYDPYLQIHLISADDGPYLETTAHG